MESYDGSSEESHLTKVTLPYGLKEIGDTAFCCCENLSEISIPTSVTSIGISAFSGCQLTNVICNIQGTDYSLVNGKLTIKNMRLDTNPQSDYQAQYPEWFNDSVSPLVTSVEFPANCTEIVDCAFDGCSITEIEIPNTIEEIGNSAFNYCNSLYEINIPSSVTSIGDGAFCVGNNLLSITFNHAPEDEMTLTIGDDAFSFIKSGAKAYIQSGYTWTSNNSEKITTTEISNPTSLANRIWTITKNS